jgi:hypothetical protein
MNGVKESFKTGEKILTKENLQFNSNSENTDKIIASQCYYMPKLKLKRQLEKLMSINKLIVALVISSKKREKHHK